MSQFRKKVLYRGQAYATTVLLSEFYFLSTFSTILLCDYLWSSVVLCCPDSHIMQNHYEIQTKYLSLCVHPLEWVSMALRFPSKQEYKMCFCFSVSLGCQWPLLYYALRKQNIQSKNYTEINSLVMSPCSVTIWYLLTDWGKCQPLEKNSHWLDTRGMIQ